MIDLATVAVIALSLVIWRDLVLGLTYFIREARIFIPIRAPLILRFQWFARLISCGQCTSTWTGMIAFSLLWPIVHAVVSIPAWSWFVVLLAGPAGAGVFDRVARSAVAVSVDKLANALLRNPGEVNNDAIRRS